MSEFGTFGVSFPFQQSTKGDYLKLTEDNDGPVRVHQFWSSLCTQEEIKELQEVFL